MPGECFGKRRISNDILAHNILTLQVGEEVGLIEGLADGDKEGADDGLVEGFPVGWALGLNDGIYDGGLLGTTLGDTLGKDVGSCDGTADGDGLLLGRIEGLGRGENEGYDDGMPGNVITPPGKHQQQASHGLSLSALVKVASCDLRLSHVYSTLLLTYQPQVRPRLSLNQRSLVQTISCASALWQIMHANKRVRLASRGTFLILVILYVSVCRSWCSYISRRLMILVGT